MKLLLSAILITISFFSNAQRYDPNPDIEYNGYLLADNHVAKIEEYMVFHRGMTDSTADTATHIMRRFLYDSLGRQTRREEKIYRGGADIIYVTKYKRSRYDSDTSVTQRIETQEAVESDDIWDGPPLYTIQHFSEGYLVSTELYSNRGEIGVDSFICDAHHLLRMKEVFEDGKLKIKTIIRYFDKNGDSIPGVLIDPSVSLKNY